MSEKFKIIPNHVAIIMDGNGRWAKKRFLPRVAGHRQGVETIKEITRRANELGIKILTIYAFSTENWARPEEEVNYLMNLPKDFFKDYLPELIENNVRVDTMGDIARLPESTHGVLKEVLDKTKDNTGMILNIALNYGGRHEITHAVQRIATDVQNGNLNTSDIDEALISSYLDTGEYNELAEPDLMIRTSGEQRLSNFLLWQLAYSEFYFTETYWPDFKAKDFDIAIETYNKRQRRYGKV